MTSNGNGGTSQFNIKQEHERLQLLIDLGKAVSSLLDYRKLLDTAAGLVIRFSEADACAIQIAERQTFELKTECLKWAENKEPDAAFCISNTVVKTVVRDKKAVRKSDVWGGSEPPSDMSGKSTVFLAKIKSLMCAPMIIEDNVIGIIYAVSDQKTNEFDNDDLEVLSAFSSHLAIAVENTRKLVENELLKLSVRDAEYVREAELIIHTLKNQLALFSLPAEMILEEVDNAQVQSYVDDILDCKMKMKNYIDEQLEIIRNRKSEESPSLDYETDVFKAVQNCIKSQHTIFKESGIDIVERVEENLPPIKIRPFDLEIVLNNLIINAIHAMESGDDKRILTITASRETENNVVIKVSDTGRGVPENLREKIFEHLFTTKTADTVGEGKEGTGIGLWHCRELLSSYGGAIDLELHQPGAGATFVVTIPQVVEEQFNIVHKD